MILMTKSINISMPLYDITDTRTNVVHEVFVSYDGLLEYLENNPHFKKVVTAPNIVSGVAGITHKTDSGFNDVMSRIAQANPHSPLADTHGNKGIKESKTRDVVKKHRALQT